MPRVGLAMHNSAMLYEVAIAAEIFGVDRSDLSRSGEWYDLVVCTADGSAHPWLPMLPTSSYAELAHVDTVVVPSVDDPDAPPAPELVEALRRSRQSGARLASLCTGAFVLAATGLLDGRAATTHWMHADDLGRRFPAVEVRADVLYVDDGDLLTSAGKSAAIDLCIYLVRQDYGAVAANGLARRLVVASRRDGGQAQFIERPPGPRSSDGLASALEWALAHLDQPLTVGDLARRAGLSTRQLARRMQTELSTRPLEWLHRERIQRAQELLEQTEASVEHVAVSCGLGTAATLRRHFRRIVGVSPTTYRATFRQPEVSEIESPRGARVDGILRRRALP